MKRFFSVLALLCGVLHGQTQGALPTVIDSLNSGVFPNSQCAVNCITMQEGANTGDLIVVAGVQPDTSFGTPCANSNPPWTVTDTLGNTYTAETSAVTPTGGVSQNDYIQLFHTVSGSTGANSITIHWGTTDCSGQIYIARFTNISGTTDGLNTANGGPGASPVTATTSNTTLVNGDLLVSFAAINSGPQGNIMVGPTLQYLGSKGTLLPEVNAVMGFANAGLAGSQSLSTIRYGGNTAGSSVMQTLAFKPSGITIVDTALPHGALTNSYSATIHGVGGAGAYTCSITAGTLQTGLSLGGSGNCTISGTPTAANTQSITFKITDGTVNTTKVLPLTVDSGFQTPFVANILNGNFDNGGGSVSLSVSCGDVIALSIAPGADTHGSTGWVQTQNGVNNFYDDSFGSPVVRVPGIAGIISGPTITYLIGPVTQSGTDKIFGVNGLTASAALEYQITDIRGVQAIADYGSFNNAITASSGTTTLTTSLTAPVSNEMVLSSTLDENTGSTISLGAPFSSTATGQDGFNAYNFGLATSVAAGSVSNAASITSGSFHTQSTEMFGLRPGALPPGCPLNTIGGEKIRHQGW